MSLTVSKAVQENKDQADQIPDKVINSLFDYRPDNPKPNQLWPPVVSCKSWNNETPPEAIHYSQEEIRAILKIVYQEGIQDGELLLSNHKNGLPSLLWGQVFTKVIALYQAAGPKPSRDSKHTILVGTLGDTKFLYAVMRDVSNLRALIIDEVYYAHIISPYFLFKKLINPPGMIIFMNSANRIPEHAGVSRFLNDLSLGLLDNRKHNIVHLHDDPKGYGISYEFII